MTEREYKLLCATCDRLLLEDNAKVERIAIAWLHVIREHPVFLRKYDFLFHETTSLFAEKWRHLRSYWSSWLWGFRQIRRTFFSRKQYQKDLLEIGSEIDFLFISHYVGIPRSGDSTTDFYFGDLPSKLAERGAKVVVAFINQTGRLIHFPLKQARSGHLFSILLPLSLDMAGENLIRRRLRVESKSLLGQSKYLSSLSAKVCRSASIEALSGASRTAMRLGIQISDLAGKLNIKNLVYTFEGHAWERVSNAMVKDAVLGVRCIAYQHAALFQRQHSIRVKMRPCYTPDIILASNRFVEDEFNQLMPKAAVVQLGSVRALQSRRLVGGRPWHPDNVCLVLPEGIEDECKILLQFSARCAFIYPDVHFVWRLHPLMSMRRLRLRNLALWSLPSNVTISKRCLEEDVGNAKWVLYRGTTAVASAVVAGARPIYLHQEGEITFDPLFRMGGFREVVKKPEDLSKIFTDNAVGSGELAAARDLCQALFPAMRTAEIAGWLGERVINLNAQSKTSIT